MPNEIIWPELQPGSVHVWVAETRPDHALNEMYLNDDELARALRLATSALKRQYVESRIALRQVLAGYLGIIPSAVTFRIGSNGKPRLAIQTSLDFNISHSNGVTAIAVGRNIALGIDIEAFRDSDEFGALAHRFFHPTEALMISEVVVSERSGAFLNAWTRKEALAKAAGGSIGATLQQLFPVGEALSGYRTQYRGEDGMLRDWFVYDLDQVPLCVGALAASCPVLGVETRYLVSSGR